jgi:HlyD family secretion protein
MGIQRMTRRRMTSLAALGVIVIIGFGLGYQYYASRQRALPAGIVEGNGRIEADEIQIATKYAGRIAEIKFQEGDLVRPGQVIARMDTAELQASERAAAAQVDQRLKESDAAQSVIKQKEALLDLANSELNRANVLVAKDAVSKQRVEQLSAAQKSARDALAAAKSSAASADAAVLSARSERERLQHMIADGTLIAPKIGRILYRLADIGETLPEGGAVATMLDLNQVYMTVFVPNETAAKVALNAPGRILVDAAPDRTIPGNVSFVSPRAQFTPKQVEVKSERERMMFRVKVRIPEFLVEKYVEKVKTGVTGVAYIQVDPKAKWPSWLQSDLTAMAAAEPAEAGSK